MGKTKSSTCKRVQKSFSKVLSVLGSVHCVGNNKNLFKILHPLPGGLVLELTDVCARLHLQMHAAALSPAFSRAVLEGVEYQHP